MTDENPTFRFYNENAQRYFQKEFAYDKTPMLLPFERLLPRNSYVLEIGGGGGRDAQWMIARGHRVLAIDNSTAMLKRMKLNAGVETLLMDMRDIDWKDTFDAVLSVASLMHITKAQAQETLYKINTALKPGGLFFVTVSGGQGEGYDEKQRYFANYQADELIQMCAKANLRMVKHLEDFTPSLSSVGRVFITFLFKKS